MPSNTTDPPADQIQFERDDDLDGVVAALSEGDRVVIDDREIPMDVIDTAREHIDSSQYETTAVYLDCRGRTYRLRGEVHYPSDEDDRPPQLELRQKGNWDMKNTWVEQIIVCGGQQILSDTRADEWFGEEMDVR